MSRVIREQSVTLHPRAECLGDSPDPNAASNCSRTWRCSPVTLEQVKQHVKQTGHQVLVVHETRSVYGRTG